MRVVISDTHIGDRHADRNLPRLFDVLDQFASPENELILNGDIFDLEKDLTIDSRHREFISAINGFGLVTYIEGNHDIFLAGLSTCIPGMNFVHQYYFTEGSSRVLAFHGHQIDLWCGTFPRITRVFVKLNKWIDSLVHVDIQRAFRRTNLVKKILLPKQEKRLISRGLDIADVVLTGHVHSPCYRKEGDIMYVNTGDWVDDRCSYFIMDGDNHELVRV